MRYNLFLLFFLFYSCGTTQNKTVDSVVSVKPTFQKIEYSDSIQLIKCTQNEAYSYALLTPKNYNSTSYLPLVIAFDPHADGLFLLDKYKDLAQKYGFVLACSMDSKNGMTTSETDAVAQIILNDCLNRLNIDQTTICALGFSGGAKVAASFAQSSPLVSSVICCGAAPNQQFFSRNPNLKLFLVAGELDFNLLEAKELALALLPTDYFFDFIQTPAKHEWPNGDAMSNVFKRLFTLKFGDSLSSYSIDLNTELLKNSNSIDLFTKAIANRTMFRYFKDENKKIVFAKILQSTEFEEYSKNLKKDIADERALFQAYTQFFSSKELSWWQNEASNFISLESKSKKNSLDAQKLRLKAYLGLAVYMYIQNVFNQNDLNAAAKLIQIYGFLEPKNSEVKMMSAKYFIKVNQAEEAIKQIQQAIKLGFNDEKRLFNDPDYQALTQKMSFQVVLDDLRAKK